MSKPPSPYVNISTSNSIVEKTLKQEINEENEKNQLPFDNKGGVVNNIVRNRHSGIVINEHFLLHGRLDEEDQPMPAKNENQSTLANRINTQFSSLSTITSTSHINPQQVSITSNQSTSSLSKVNPQQVSNTSNQSTSSLSKVNPQQVSSPSIQVISSANRDISQVNESRITSPHAKVEHTSPIITLGTKRSRIEALGQSPDNPIVLE